jgi:hypothetical protein
MDAATLSPHDLAASISAAWANALARTARRGVPHRYVYASSWRPCDRRIVYEMTQPESQPVFSPELLAKFRRGDDRERDLLIDLARVGRESEPPFAVLGQQERFEVKGKKGQPVIVGKVDARLKFEPDISAPLECKAWHPNLVAAIKVFEDLFDNPWTRAGAYQLLLYLLAMGVPFGFLLLDRSGLPLLLPVELNPHLDRLEDFLTRAERAMGHAEAGTLPDFLVGDAAECRRCSFYGSVCNPPLSATGATVITDPEIEALLVRREQLDAAATEFDQIDKTIKGRLRGIESAVAGPFIIEGKWGKQSRIDLPPDLKGKYTKTDPQGRFTLTFTRLGPPATEVTR